MSYLLESNVLFIFIVIILIVLIIFLLRLLKMEENKMDKLRRAKLDRITLEQITKNIETDYKPINIKLTSYEEEQEHNAIISYDELVNNKDKKINYDTKFENKIDLPVKKVDLDGKSNKTITETKVNVSLMSYEHEEAFLRALKQLQRDLAR